MGASVVADGKLKKIRAGSLRGIGSELRERVILAQMLLSKCLLARLSFNSYIQKNHILLIFIKKSKKETETT